MKKVLLVCQSQDGSFVNILAESIKRNGASLSIFTGKNNDIRNDVSVILSTHYNSSSIVNRFKTWFSFVRDARKFLVDHIEEYDLVMFVSNPPINQALVRFAQKKVKKTVYLVWDIYPDCIEKTFGWVVKPIVHLWKIVNKKMYFKCDEVLTIGYEMKARLESSYNGLNVKVIPYHANTPFIHPIEKGENPFISQYNLEDKTILMYSGKMGRGHSFVDILHVAKDFLSDDSVAFVLIGFGEEFDNIKNYVADNDLKNTLVLGYQPLEMLPYTLGAADVSFITIKTETDGLFLPSKVYDAMASGSAIICLSAGNNDVAKMIESNGVGVNVLPGDVEELKRVIHMYVDDKQLLYDSQKKSYELAYSDYDKETIVNQYYQFFSLLL